MEDRTDLRRRSMVIEQIAARGVANPRILEAMERIPRDAFVPSEDRNRAYDDHPLHIGHGQTISQPFMVATMLDALELCESDRVLEIGTGSGYQTALLMALVRDVTTMERLEPLTQVARDVLVSLGLREPTWVLGDGTLGWPAGAPYDAIVVTAAGPRVPPSLCEQLADGGRLVLPVGEHVPQELLRIRRHGSDLRQERLGPCVFVRLIGAEGWTDE